MTTNQIPEYVIECLEEVRQSGACNMFDRGCVIGQLAMQNNPRTLLWLMGDDGLSEFSTPTQRQRYLDAVIAMGEKRASR